MVDKLLKCFGKGMELWEIFLLFTTLCKGQLIFGCLCFATEGNNFQY